MALQTFDKPLKAIEGETVTLANGEIDYILPKPNFDSVQLYSASAWRMALCPVLIECQYYTAAAGTYTNYRTPALDKVATTHVPLDAMLATDYLYMGFSEPVLGVYLNPVTNVNAVTATLDVEYSSTAIDTGSALAFTDVPGTDSDGTNSGTATLAIPGVYTWTLPTAWVQTKLGTYAAPLFTKCYWIRFKPSATLSATVDVVDITPVYKNTNYGYMEAAVTYIVPYTMATVGGFMFIGTAAQTLNVTWLQH